MKMKSQKHKELMETIAQDLIQYCKENDFWYDVRIYYNGMAIGSNDDLIRNINPKDYFEYPNPDTVSMSFEGPLYEAINYGYAYRDIQLLLGQYGYCFELGNAWNLSIYEL